MKTDNMIQSKPCSRVQSVGRWLSAAALGVAVNFSVPLVTTAVEPVLGHSTLGKVQAQDKKKQQQTRRTPAIRAKIFEKLNEAQVLAEEKKYNEALGKLNELRDKEGRGALNRYELANLFNLYAFIYFTMEDYDKALGAYEEVIKQPDIPYAMEVNTKFTIAQLYFVKEDWKKGVNTLLDWFKLKEELGEPVGANAHALLSQGYYQLGDQR